MMALLIAAQMLPKWVWAQPLEPVTRGELAGYSKKQIVEMGQDKWGDIAYKHYLSGADRDTLIFARCAYDLNQPLIRKHPQIGTLRKDLWLMADASIALHWYRDGEGTSSIHLPRDARADVEELTYYLLNHPKKVMLRLPEGDLIRTNRRDLASWLTSTTPPPYHSGTLGTVHAYARRAVAYFDRAIRIMRKLDPTRRREALAFIDDWTVAGLDRRDRDQ